MKRLPSHGIVNLAALDLRARPDHRAELCSQLLMGEVVEMVSAGRDGRWLRVRNRADHDVGWARRWGLVAASRRQADAWESRARHRVTAALTIASIHPGGEALMPLVLNGRLVAGSARGRFRRAELPDGRRAWVRGSDLGPLGPRGRVSIEARVGSLMGVPYLWGGRTPVGLDCSAFTQLVLAETGVRLPRDAHQQFRWVERLRAGAESRRGDLIFFGTGRRRAEHVGIVLGGEVFAHARGWVRINSFDPRNALYDSELGAQIIGYGRPPVTPITT